MPAGKCFKLGVWEYNKFIGCVIFSRGANCNMSKYFKLENTDICELSRVALATHKTEVSRILRISINLLKKHSPNLKLIFSYSDITNQNHNGGIYRADNWKLINKSVSNNGHVLFQDKIIHNRSISSKFLSKSRIPENLKSQFKKLPPQEKYLFIKILDKNLKISASSRKNDASSYQLDEGGLSPTDALHI